MQCDRLSGRLYISGTRQGFPSSRVRHAWQGAAIGGPAAAIDLIVTIDSWGCIRLLGTSPLV